MANTPYQMTFLDALDHCETWLEGSADVHNTNKCIRAVQLAYRELGQKRDWSFLFERGTITTEAPYSTGTIAFDLTGGANERQLTLTGGTWPTNALYGVIRIADVEYEVEDRKSDTILTLTASNSPTADIAASTSYEWFRSVYTLPVDFIRIDMPHTDYHGLSMLQPGDAHFYQIVTESQGEPWFFAVISDPNLHGAHAIRVFPSPDSERVFYFYYMRRPKQLKISGKHNDDSVGSVTTDGTTTVEGTSTLFRSRHVGSVIRFGYDATDEPTGVDGRFPFQEERIIQTVTDTDTIIVDAAVDTLTSVKYVISDPVDYDEGMINIFLRTVEKQLAMLTRTESSVKKAVYDDWKLAYLDACESDSRYMEKHEIGPYESGWGRARVVDM